MQNNEQHLDAVQQRKGRMVFMLMLIFFIVPIVVVIMMYQLNWKPNGESLGDLVKPPRLLVSPSALLDSESKPLSALLWKEKWSIVFVAGECETACLSKLKDMRQLHVSLYKDIARTQRILITTTQDVTAIKNDFPDLIVINQPQASIAELTNQFQIQSEDTTSVNRLYLVDPLGFLMMSYQAETPLLNVRKDITRLLRYSWAG